MLPPARPKGTTIHSDDAIRETDDDAAASRLSAVNLGYLTDPFLPLIYKPPRPRPTGASRFRDGSGTGFGAGSGFGAGAGAGPSLGVTPRKPPLINVGTHHRTVALDLVVDRFFKEGGRQVVSLGAGSDTRFWRIMARDDPPDLAHYVELDFPHLTAPKAQRIARSPKLVSLLSRRTPVASSSTPSDTARGRIPDPQTSVTAATPRAGSSAAAPSSSPTAPPNPLASTRDLDPALDPNPSPSTHHPPYTISKGGTQLSSPLYTLFPLDLRDASSPSSPSSPGSLGSLGSLSSLEGVLDPALPTLFLAECVLCYMEPQESEAVISWFGRFRECVGVIYEMCGLDDQFGTVMRRNLATRGLSLPGAVFPTPKAQAGRFLADSLGPGVFDRAGAKSLWEIRESVVPPTELRRISRIEHLDEIEELRLVLSHYCVAWGTRGERMARVGL
ncbi:Leucine carboxyl methyltransferase 1 [Saitozyma sp. JCM 24511]|nr:Leucine carboxyl methyltransferase 1 [Saitozyma sp. JCM 24511]